MQRGREMSGMKQNIKHAAEGFFHRFLPVKTASKYQEESTDLKLKNISKGCFFFPSQLSATPVLVSYL